MENKPIKIVAIDDTADNLITLKALIREVFENSEIFTCLSGEEGIRTAMEENPDVILLDVIMPGMDGYETCRLIKSDSGLADVPVVFVTAVRADKESRIKALEAGAEGFLSKPVDQAELIAQIKAMHIIRESRAEKQLREKRLTKLVEEQTHELRMAHNATLRLLAEMHEEVEARKKSEEALRESEQRYKALIDNSMDAILLTSPDGRIFSANAAACEMFGRTEEEFRNLGRDCIISKNDQRYLKFVSEREKCSRVRCEIWLVRKNGEAFLAEVSSAIFSPRPYETYSSLIIRDATRRVEAESTLENERLLLRTLINNIPDSIYCKDLSYKKTIANITDVGYMGAKSESEVIGKGDFDFYPEELAKQFYADDRMVIEEGKPLLNREEVLYDKEGRKRWLLSSKLPLRDRNNEIVGLVGVGRDITELKRREQVLTMQYNMAIAKAHRKSLGELFEVIKNDLNQLMEAENLILAMLNADTGMLHAPIDFENETLSPKTWPAESSLTGWILKQKKAYILTQPEIERLVAEENLVRFGPPSKCWMGVPLFDQNDAVGVLILQSYTDPAAYDDSCLEIVELIASQLISYMMRLEAEETALKLNKAVEQSPDTIIITNTSGIIEYVNPMFTEHTGYTAEEAIGQTPRLLNSGKHPKSYYQSIWDSLLAGKNWNGEIMNRRKDGSLYWENASIAPLFNNNGEVTHYIAIKEEITEKKKTEAALKYHVNLQSMLIKIASGYINVNFRNLDATIQSSLAEMGGFAAADRAYIYEYDLENKIARNSYEWCAEGIEPVNKTLPRIDLKDMDVYVDAFSRGQIIFVSDNYLINVNDELKSVYASRGIKSGIVLPMMDGDKCIGFVGFDWVREHHRYQEGEKVMLSIFSQLLVNVRLKSKLEHKLIVQKEKAEAASRLKTAFLNNISHEVRTPINGILGFGRMLVEPGISQDEKKEYYQVMEDSCNRLIHTVTSFMDMSLLTSGNMTVVRKSFSLHYFLGKIYNQYKSQYESRQVQLKLVVNSNLEDLLIQTDEELLKKLFDHLLENAFKFTKVGLIQMGYTYRNNKVVFFVSDSGIGIDHKILNEIFEPFVQEEAGESRTYEGSGLGLAISKGIAGLLGGTLSINSEKGKGTSVYFTIQPHEIEDLRAADPSEASPLHESCVLIAEDDDANKLFMETILDQEGITHLAVENGKLAVDACHENRDIKVILMDLKMPVMGGMEAMRQIKKFRPDVAIIAVTSHAMKGDRESAIKEGFDDYIAKPYTKDMLVGKIRFFLKDELSGTN